MNNHYVLYMYCIYQIIYPVVHVCVFVTIHIYSSTCVSVFLIILYSTLLAQRASYLALHSSFFWAAAQLIMIILSLTALTLS